MKLFDIVGGKVVIHPDALGIPCFRNIWDNNKDKDYVRNIISYIVLKNKYDSPYVQSMDADEAEKKLKTELFHDPEYKLTADSFKDLSTMIICKEPCRIGFGQAVSVYDI